MVDEGEHGHRWNGALAPLTESLARRAAAEQLGPAIGRDVGFVRRMIPAVERYVRYFSPQIRGIENLPTSGPVLVVGNHSGVFYMPDTWLTALAITARRGVDAPAYGLIHNLFFAIPIVGPSMRRLGGVPASGDEAERVLGEGALLLDYPGGDTEACRPWSDRNRIVFSGHTGFIRLALRTGVPVVPVVGYGGHQSLVVLSRGEHLARVLGLGRLRIKVFPILLGPWGVTSILTPPPPLPSAVTVEFMPPIDWSALGQDAAEDPAIVAACYAEITQAMQVTLDRLHAEQPHPVLRGFSHLLHGSTIPGQPYV